MGLGRGDFSRPLDDFRVGSSRAATVPGPLTGVGGGGAGMRNSGLIVWHVREILRDDLKVPAYRAARDDEDLCLPAADES